MSAGYMIGSFAFAILCTCIWLALGNTVFSAVTVYILSGQCAMLALVGQAVLRTAPTRA